MPPKKRQIPGTSGEKPKRQRKQRSPDVESLPQIDYDRLAEAILKKQGQVTESDNGGLPVSPAPSKDADTPLQVPSTCSGNSLPDTANTTVNTNNVLGAAQQSSFLLTLDKIFGESLPKGPLVRENTNTSAPRIDDHLTSNTMHLLQASLSTPTKLAYRRSWEYLMKFCLENQVKFHFPVSHVLTANFISHLFNQKYSPSTIASHCSANSFVHKLMGSGDHNDLFLF